MCSTPWQHAFVLFCRAVAAPATAALTAVKASNAVETLARALQPPCVTWRRTSRLALILMQAAIKFYLDRRGFERERELYTESQLRAMMPATLAVEDNASGDCKTPYGYVFPPFVIIERGESLDEWSRDNANKDIVTIFQVQPHASIPARGGCVQFELSQLWHVYFQLQLPALHRFRKLRYISLILCSSPPISSCGHTPSATLQHTYVIGELSESNWCIRTSTLWCGCVVIIAEVP